MYSDNPCVFRYAYSHMALDGIAGIISWLRNYNYERIQDVPLRPYPKTKGLEEYEDNFAVKDSCRIFQVTYDPARYEALLDESLTFLRTFFFLNLPISTVLYRKIVPKKIRLILRHELLLQESDNLVRCVLRFVPIGRRIYLTSAFDRELPYFTYLSEDSRVFANLVRKKFSTAQRKSILDLCCGVGFVGLELAGKGDSLQGIDINKNALAMAELNALLHQGCRASFDSSMPLNGKWDLIVCNPPFIFMPEENKSQVDSYGGAIYGLEKTLHFLEATADLLSENGEAYMITRSPVMEYGNYLFHLLQEKDIRLSGNVEVLCHNDGDICEKDRRLGIKGYQHVFVSCSKSQASRWEFLPVDKGLEYRFFF